VYQRQGHGEGGALASVRRLAARDWLTAARWSAAAMPGPCAPGTTKPRPYEGRGFARAGRLPFAGGAVAVAVQLATEARVAAVKRPCPPPGVA
jgi:hypothetical protein